MNAPAPAHDVLNPGAGARSVLLLAAALCWAASMPPVGFAPAAWFMPLLLLAGIEGFGPRDRITAGALTAATCGVILMISWRLTIGEAAALVFGGAIATGLWAWLAFIPSSFRDSPWNMLWPAAAWVAMSYLRAEVFPLPGVWPALGYSQIDAAPAWLLPLGGVYLVDFVLFAWAGAVLGLSLHLRRSPHGGVLLVALASMLLLSVLPVPRTGTSEGPARPVLLVQTGLAVPPMDAAELMLGAVEGRPKPWLALWPLDTYATDPVEEMAGPLAGALVRCASLTQAGLAFGGPSTWKDRHREFEELSLHLFRPEGTPRGETPGLLPNVARDATTSPFQRPLVVALPAPAGVVTAAFYAGDSLMAQAFARRAAKAGAELLAVSFDARKESFAAMRAEVLRARAAESGCPVVSSARLGPTLHVAADGALVERAEYGATRLISASVAVRGPKQTLFVLLGWMLAPAAVIAATLVGAMEVHRLLKHRADAAEDAAE